MTVGAQEGTAGYGFSVAGGFGALSDVDFDLGSTTGVAIARFRVGSGTLAFESDLPVADRPALRLHACAEPFDLADATPAGNTLRWADTGLDWSGAYKVSLALSASSDATLGALAVGGTPVADFAADNLSYTAAVANSTTRVTVEPTVAERGALVAFLDADDAVLDDADGTVDGHQVDLAAGSNTVNVRVTSGDRDTTLVYTVTVTRGAPPNNAPVFSPDTTGRTVPENTAAGTAIGAVIPAATDADGDALTYTLEGTDAASFAFDAATRQISTSAALDHEAKASYSVTVKAVDTSNASDTIAVTIDVGDVAEQPDTPAAPTVQATANKNDSLDVTWTAPGLNGGPAITGYRLRHRGGGAWTEVTPPGTGTMHAIGSLAANTAYEVQVRALNGETDSDWSASGSGTTAMNNAPVFSPDTTDRTVPENTAAGTAIGAVIPAATDADGDALTYTLEGTDAASFAFDAATRQISTSAALDHEAKASYSVTVKAVDTSNASDTIAVTIDVGDVAEQPDTPAAPTVQATANKNDSLDVTWTAPGLNGGPAITGYRLRHRGGGAWTEVTPPGTGTMHAIGSLAANTAYEVQVRALNGETDSDWSASGSGTTAMNNAPVFSPDTTDRTVPENTAAGTAIGAAIPEATDADGDALTYTLEGTDAASFAFDGTTRQISTSAALDHEAKASYSVTVKAVDTSNASDTIAVTIAVTDVAEKPDTPAAPTVQATANKNDSLDVTWTAPGRNGGPAITGYRLRHRTGGGAWTEVTPPGTGTMHAIGSLAANTAYDVQVRALNGETDSDWSASGSGTTAMNNAPVFSPDTTDRTVPENTAAGTAIGAVIPEATDADGDALTYTLEGTDAASFAFDGTTRQISTSAALDHEAKASYSVTVKAVDTSNASDTIAVTIAVTDVAEKPDTPAALTVAPTANKTDSVDVDWTKPGLNGGPEISGYRLRRRVRGVGAWIETTPAGTGTRASIGSLEAGTEYAVQVRALNGETPSDWSDAGFGSTGSASNEAPEFEAGPSAMRDVDENATARALGEAFTATDDDGDMLTYSLQSGDGTLFQVVGTSGQLRTRGPLNHESAASHAVTLKVEDGNGGTDTIAVTVNVNDVDEAPSAPAAPTVSAQSGRSTSLSVRWSEPANSGPPVTEYDLRYRESAGAWADGPAKVPGRSSSVGGLEADTAYDVQVLARNAEGESGWSASGSGRTNAEDVELAVLTMHALAGSVAVGERAEFEIRRSGGDMGWLKARSRITESEGYSVETWGWFKPGASSRTTSMIPEVTGTLTARVTGPNPEDERCPDVAPFPPGCTDNYEIGSPSSATMRVTAASQSVPVSARVAGDLLTLRYADPLDAGSTPGPKDWVVRAATDAGSRTLAVTAVSVGGAKVALALSPPVVAGESVTVSYLPWAMHPLIGPAGIEASPLTELAARNETPASAPVEGHAGALAEAVEAADDAVIAGAVPAGEPAAAPPEPFGPWLAALLAERPAASLVRLDAPDRGLTDVSALAGLRGLEVLDLHGNAVEDVWPLAGLGRLRRLDLSGNRIGDVSALAGLVQLEVLLLDGNRVVDVLPLALLPRLARLDLSGNRVADAVLLAELRSLARLDLSGNRVGDTSPLGDLSRLVWLDLTGNPVSDLAPLGRLTALRWLWLDAQAPGLGSLAPLAEGPTPVRIELRGPVETASPR